MWEYGYDVLGRRINKRLKNGENLQNTAETRFIWDGSHLVQEIHKSDGKNGTENDRTYSYIYTHPSSYEPLAQLEFAKNETNPTACYYYHNGQIGIPRELTDEEGKLCWTGEYTGWGKLKNSTQLVEDIHQPFRLQNQYFDQETGLHYNFFRYYEPNVGRFTQLDPIGLEGGENFYRFADNILIWKDVLGLEGCFQRILNAADELNNKTKYSKKSHPGDIVAVARDYNDATGHVAIVMSYDGEKKTGTTIGAGGRTGSHTTTWPWDGSSTQGTYIYRRCMEVSN